jgi:hypothetical protein
MNPLQVQDKTIIYPTLRDFAPVTNPVNVINAIRSGKCHQVYGISDFNQNACQGAEKFNKKY